MLKGFIYIADENSNILILGTFPGAESRKLKEYYGNKRNQFWKLLFDLYNEKYSDDTDYIRKIEFLIKNNIGLWDIIEKCDTDGSLDSDIKNPIYNDISKFLDRHTNISKIYCNGKLVYRYLGRLIDKNKYDIYILPSSSPTNTIKYETKLKMWKSILKK